MVYCNQYNNIYVLITLIDTGVEKNPILPLGDGHLIGEKDIWINKSNKLHRWDSKSLWVIQEDTSETEFRKTETKVC